MCLRNEIRKAMVDKGFNQKTLAKRLGISEATMSYWLQHTDSITVGKLARICAVLKLNPEVIGKSISQ